MRVPALTLLLLGLLLALSPVNGQEARGLIVEGNPLGEASLYSLNPLLCDNAACRRLVGLMFPTLLRVDAQTRTFAPATATDGLAESWEIDGSTATFHLRSDRTWSDGTPITAYDVYFSYLAAVSKQTDSPYATLKSVTRAAAPLDAATFAVALDPANCDSLDKINFPVVPAHVFDPAFADSVHFDGGDLTAWYDAQPQRDFSAMLDSDFNRAPNVTAGPFRFDSRSFNRDVRLLSADGKIGFDYVDSLNADETVDRFLRGEINLLIDPPFDRRQDIRAANGVTVIEKPGNTLYSIRLNLADPNHPADDKDEDGNPLDQGRHPIFSDPAVINAIQIAIDPQPLIDAALQGDGVAVAGSLPPSSWAFDAARPQDYDPHHAERILEAAGWKDLNGDGVRECVTCASARPGTGLTFTLLYDSNAFIDGAIIANLIVQQLEPIGIRVQMQGYNDPVGDLTAQSFDAALIGVTEPTPDQSADFTAAGDTRDGGRNYGSYRNDALTALFDQARSVLTCDVKTRADVYAQAQQVLRDVPPSIWLFSPNRMIAVRDDARALQPFVEETLP